MKALALKYRPKNFDELIGQEAVSQSLSHALQSNRIGHAYLFSGLRGSGKTSSARIFSKVLVCDNPQNAKPCETCNNCKMANESRHLDIIEMDAASHRGIDDIKELIEQTKYAPSMAKYKIFIIDEVHMLSTPAFNALLKTLEEPPSYVKFILATTDPLKLPATVLSRTQHFRFKQIPRHLITKQLEHILNTEGITYEKEALQILARSGQGSLRDTLTLLDQAIIYSSNNVTQNAVASMLGLLDPARIDDIFKAVLQSDKEQISSIVSQLEEYEATMIIDELTSHLKTKFLAHDPSFSLLVTERFFRIFAQAKSMLNTTSDNSFVITIMLFMMMEAQNLKTIDEAINEVQNQNTTKDQAKQQDKQTNNKQKNAYEILLDKIFDRDYNLGEIFQNNTEFVEFDGINLSIISNAQGRDRDELVSKFGLIMSILKQLFGENAKIINVKKKQSQDKILQINEEDELQKELQKLQEAEIIQPKSEPKKIQSISEALSSINKNKSPQELQELKNNAILQDAKAYFGTPKIIKINQ
ncbi:DNA polymerase III subunit gamma/tau [Campylobacter majalis]|uniref:DNA polymerase III subunit gamma/tau n=1 Tax=Campylobacter majalis TaxID=2790656 RepID=UPI003D6894BB